MFVTAEDFEEWWEEDTLIEFEREMTAHIDPELWLEFCLRGPTRTTGSGTFE